MPNQAPSMWLFEIVFVKLTTQFSVPNRAPSRWLFEVVFVLKAHVASRLSFFPQSVSGQQCGTVDVHFRRGLDCFTVSVQVHFINYSWVEPGFPLISWEQRVGNKLETRLVKILGWIVNPRPQVAKPWRMKHTPGGFRSRPSFPES